MEPGHARVLSTFPSRPCDRPSDGSPEVMFDRVILTNIRHHARLPRRPELEAALTAEAYDDAVRAAGLDRKLNFPKRRPKRAPKPASSKGAAKKKKSSSKRRR